MTMRAIINSPAFFWIRIFGAFPVDKNVTYKKACAYTEELIGKGYNILIFPEGGITKDGNLQPGRPGIAYLSQKYDLPILPIAITGTYKLTVKKFLLRKNQVRVHIGPKFYYRDVAQQNDNLREAAQKIMHRVNCLLTKSN